MYKIGEFARIAYVSSHLLRHYDDIELFTPQEIDKQSGYRYYSVEQLPRLHRIIALRELGFSLEQIHKLLDDKIADCEIQGMLKLKRQQIEQHIEQEHARLRRIETRLQQIVTNDTPPQYDVVIKSVPAMTFLSTGAQLLTSQASSDILDETRLWLRQCTNETVGFSLVLLHGESTPEGLHHIEPGFAVSGDYPDGVTLSTGRRLTTRTVDPIENVASVIHHGSRHNLCPVYTTLFRWMDSNGYRLREGHLASEIYMQANEDPKHRGHIIEIQVPII